MARAPKAKTKATAQAQSTKNWKRSAGPAPKAERGSLAQRITFPSGSDKKASKGTPRGVSEPRGFRGKNPKLDGRKSKGKSNGNNSKSNARTGSRDELPLSGYATEASQGLIPGQGLLSLIKVGGLENFDGADDAESDAQSTDLESESEAGDSGSSVSSLMESGAAPAEKKEAATLAGGSDFISFGFSDSEPEAESNESKEGTSLKQQFAEYEAEMSVEAAMQEKKDEEKAARKRAAAGAAALPIPKFQSPWLPSNGVHDTSSLTTQLNAEARYYVHYLRPTPVEGRGRTAVIARVRKLVDRLWPSATLSVFGSHPTGLYLPGADLDIVINTPQMQLVTGSAMYKLSAQVRRNGWAQGQKVEVIRHARVPLVKYTDAHSGLQIDISFEQTNGMPAVETVRRWVQDIRGLKPLVLIVKMFLQRHRLSEVFHGGIGGFSTVCMVASFLKNHKEVRSGAIDPLENLGILLMQFLQFYGQDLNATRDVLVMTGEMPIQPKSQVSLEYGPNRDILAIQDPNDPYNNVSRSSYAWNAIRREFRQALEILKRTCSEYEDLGSKQRAHWSFLAPVMRISNSQRRHQADLDSIHDGTLVTPDWQHLDEALNVTATNGSPSKKGRSSNNKHKRRDSVSSIDESESVDGEDRIDFVQDKRGKSHKHSIATEQAPAAKRARDGAVPKVANAPKPKTRSVDLFEAGSSSDGSEAPARGRKVPESDSSDSDQDSRTRMTPEQRRGFWLAKGVHQTTNGSGK